MRLKKGSRIRVWIIVPLLCCLALACLYPSKLFRQYNLAASTGGGGNDRGGDTARASYPSSSSSSSYSRSRQLDDILSKYNLTSAILARSYPKATVPNANRSMAFLHIGKTGGSTISTHLRHGCRTNNPMPCKDRNDGWITNETSTSRRIGSYYHLEDVPSDRLRDLTTIVTVVRNPMARFASAFACGHPSNAVATDSYVDIESVHKYSCFPTLGYLVKAGMGRALIPWNMAYLRKGRPVNGGRIVGNRIVAGGKVRTDDVRYNCTELALVAFFGLNESRTESVVGGDVEAADHPWFTHMSFNYRRYYRSMPPGKELIVMRTDHLREDWEGVHRLLGGDDAWADTAHHPFLENERNVSGNYRTKERWWIDTPEEQLWLCMLLHDEIRHYIMIISRAVNLDEDDLFEALVDVDGMCNETRVRGNATSLL